MLRRQRTILKLLSSSPEGLSTTQLQKFLFLLRNETFIRDDSAFFDFVPYKFGPYSFAAAREIETLASYSYIELHPADFGIRSTITPLGRREAFSVDDDTAKAVTKVVNHYGTLSTRALMKNVYSRYKWYATRTEAKELLPVEMPTQRPANLAVYTLGYEEKSIDSFFDKLLHHGIRQIIDVRANPVSRKFGFARSSLASISSKLSICYKHIPELGITSELRKSVETPAQFKELFQDYERNLAKKGKPLAEVAKLMQSAPSVLVCMEKEAVDCHRSRLASKVSSTNGLKIVHL